VREKPEGRRGRMVEKDYLIKKRDKGKQRYSCSRAFTVVLDD